MFEDDEASLTHIFSKKKLGLFNQFANFKGDFSSKEINLFNGQESVSAISAALKRASKLFTEEPAKVSSGEILICLRNPTKEAPRGM